MMVFANSYGIFVILRDKKHNFIKVGLTLGLGRDRNHTSHTTAIKKLPVLGEEGRCCWEIEAVGCPRANASRQFI